MAASAAKGVADAVRNALGKGVPALNARTAVLGLCAAGAVFWIVALAGVAAVHQDCDALKSSLENAYRIYLSSSSSGSSIEATCVAVMQLPWWTIWFNAGIYIAAAYVVSRRRALYARIQRAALNPRIHTRRGAPPLAQAHVSAMERHRITIIAALCIVTVLDTMVGAARCASACTCATAAAVCRQHAVCFGVSRCLAATACPVRCLQCATNFSVPLATTLAFQRSRTQCAAAGLVLMSIVNMLVIVMLGSFLDASIPASGAEPDVEGGRKAAAAPAAAAAAAAPRPITAVRSVAMSAYSESLAAPSADSESNFDAQEAPHTMPTRIRGASFGGQLPSQPEDANLLAFESQGNRDSSGPITSPNYRI
jgi:hypothetical protein